MKGVHLLEDYKKYEKVEEDAPEQGDTMPNTQSTDNRCRSELVEMRACVVRARVKLN